MTTFKYDENALQRLREMLKPGDTVYTKLNHVSRSGLYRVINLYAMLIIEGKPIPYCIDNLAAGLLEGYDSRHGGCKAGGAGMDMGGALVYELSRKLFPDGFTCTTQPDCPGSSHSGGYDLDYGPHPHKDGGYALRQRWL